MELGVISLSDLTADLHAVGRRRLVQDCITSTDG